jgi:NDP-sugar pyrophosphorylase family protein
MHAFTDLTAAILAGGLGTRLRPVVSDRPKVLAHVAGKPFLSFLLDQISNQGFKLAVLCTGYLGDQVSDLFGERYGNLRLLYSQEPRPLGTAGALRLALPMLESDSVLVLNGDSYCEADLTAFWDFHCAKKAEATLLSVRVSDARRYGRVRIDPTGLVTHFEEKDERAAPGWINAGIYLIKRRLVRTFRENEVLSLERSIFPHWIGKKFYACRSQGSFLDIGIPADYGRAEMFFARGNRG